MLLYFLMPQDKNIVVKVPFFIFLILALVFCEWRLKVVEVRGKIKFKTAFCKILRYQFPCRTLFSSMYWCCMKLPGCRHCSSFNDVEFTLLLKLLQCMIERDELTIHNQNGSVFYFVKKRIPVFIDHN